MISLIVAHDKNRVIGYKNEMPWHLPGDLKYFKETTMGKPIIMGRKTFESIGRPLPGRRNIVITRNKGYHHDGIEVASSLDEALRLAGNAGEIMVIGGEQIFKLALPLADRLYVTHIDHEFVGDTYFPEYGDEWKVISKSEVYETKEGYTYQYVVYERK
ncbi:type 3 dihydrofolate reductase [Ureibacillus sp. FSL K6-8385]|uniref:Dihydrofolate reductase n=2 Tax=Caryophanaceae TaxID=186818 RepID=A0A540V195_9BACL|nr:type 3 dihydrofolate reductase [Ureibacillus terrenus]MED3662339.1 type 3 dihydrofolate reductase [Ureibacillus terrenus]MED3764523.1 type 3 dihydrofolate reductase [Ureibacillus terrenus]TQE90519.1 type 3 dihydrofolate reductase [Ureibacillus terrenus]